MIGSHFSMDAYRMIFEKMDMASYLLDVEGRLVACNRKLLRFLGIDSQYDNSIYTMFRQQGLWTSQQIQQIQYEDSAALISGQNNTTIRQAIHASGRIVYFEFIRTPLFDESGLGFGLMVGIRDVTQQKHMEEKLRSLEERLKYCNTLSHTPVESAMATACSDKIPKILIVEDNLITQKEEDKVLKLCHCYTDVVATLKQVKEIFMPGKYDLALVDLGLGSGNGNGYQVTALLREMEKGGQFRVPIIALTGADLSTVASDCDDSEMDGMLAKPLTYDQAKQLIQRYVQHVDVEVTGLRAFK